LKTLSRLWELSRRRFRLGLCCPDAWANARRREPVFNIFGIKPDGAGIQFEAWQVTTTKCAENCDRRLKTGALRGYSGRPQPRRRVCRLRTFSLHPLEQVRFCFHRLMKKAHKIENVPFLKS
jgi:hypothetical protein